MAQETTEHDEHTSDEADPGVRRRGANEPLQGGQANLRPGDAGTGPEAVGADDDESAQERAAMRRRLEQERADDDA